MEKTKSEDSKNEDGVKHIIENEVQLVIFTLAGEEFGIDINQVREIIKITDITRVPHAPPFVEGVINLRGTITTIVDLRKILNLQIKEVNSETRIIEIELEKGGTIGIVVDSVTEVLRLREKDIDPTPSITTDLDTEYMRGVGKLDDRIIILLDLNKVFEKEVV